MRDKIVSIIAGGWSVKAVDLSQIPGTIIGVNDSSIHAPCDIVVSMDRLWTEYRWQNLRQMQKPAWIRRSALKNVDRRFPWLHSFECDHESTEFSGSPDFLNGTNSGLCAFNLAYQFRPEQIYLFGFDMKRGPKGECYWHEPYPWKPEGATSSGKYSAWSKQFKDAARLCKSAGIDVTVVGDSAIDCFRKVSAKEFARVAA